MMKRVSTLAAILITLTSLPGCEKDPSGPAISGSFTLVPGTIPRTSTQTQCTIISESGTLTITGRAYSIKYEQGNQCSAGTPILYGLEDRGVVEGSGSVITFRSESALFPSPYTGTIDANDVTVTLPTWGVVRYRR